jgi:hypothetical protein
MSLEQIRDIVIIVYGVMGVLLMLAMAIAAFGVWFAVRALTRSVRNLLEDPIRPTLEEVHKTAQHVRGTAEFVNDTAVHPIIRTVSTVRGIRRGVASVTGIRNRRRRGS